MKTIIYIYTLVLILMITCFSSCELAEEIDDFERPFSLGATEITNESTAELALTGIYAGFGTFIGGGNPHIYIIPSLLSGVAQPGFSRDAESEAISINVPLATGTVDMRGGYARLYGIINNANWLLEGIEDIPEATFSNPDRKTEIIAEAKGMRATAHFYLLRLWGQFYDLNSNFGIVVKTTPATSNEAFPRNNVADSYAIIMEDLDNAIAHAPDLRAKYFINKSYAKALKAKVLLYQGNYPQAAALAKEVLDTSGSDFQLAATVTEIFDNTNEALFNSSELLFGSRGITNEEDLRLGNFWGGAYAELTDDYRNIFAENVVINGQTISYDDNNRFFEDLSGGAGKFAEFFPFAEETFEMLYHMRIAELYLIYAEADARANNTVTADALGALNAVRTRAGATTTGADGFETYPINITLPEFLEAVRVEKWVELGTEMGEEWFDLVRYDAADGFGSGFQVSDVKPSATDPDKFILPIPSESIQSGGNVVEQNPGYN
ncbi:RagB/SusD family nutrient uptake outer membrane protein [Zobellia uliginosa]|uniref:RagB/SusD family nutrient uptake outer membrane protein n=1 Tax=Zobellia uliginosa TaxID=143224 RepID=UPI0026E23653|nr:RagB/SusD family nutrient uptake outer membrane protein [Zobellia uliginosa]MDO6516001.1 RagB/SusD family nutrient uptake outer membrane protein [Zobellia uliginosa]